MMTDKKIKFKIQCRNCNTEKDFICSTNDLFNECMGGVIVFQAKYHSYGFGGWNKFRKKNPNPYDTLKCDFCNSDELTVITREPLVEILTHADGINMEEHKRKIIM